MGDAGALHILPLLSDAGGAALGLLSAARLALVSFPAAFWVSVGVAGITALIWHLRRGDPHLARTAWLAGDVARVPCEASLGTFSPASGAGSATLEKTSATATQAHRRIQELEAELKIANAARDYVEAILQSISDAVMVTNSCDNLILANESAARAFNFDLSAARHAPLEKVLGDPCLIEMMREMRHTPGEAGRRVVEHAIKGQGINRTYQVTLSHIAEGKPHAGVVAVLHDKTREKEVSEIKNDFVSMVSHELRTPLASIKAYIEMLIDGEAEDEKTEREFYEVIQNEANRLGRLIDNILSLSRIESGLASVTKQPESLAEIAKDALEVIAPQAQQKQITLTQDLPGPIYKTLADRDMLYQAMLNLIGNAVKYTPAGGCVDVKVSIDEQKRKATATISDTGVGIPPKDLPFVFDKFFRAEANSRMAPGTGLGLSLVKHIIESVHQGRIFLESRVGSGSCFRFELDLCESSGLSGN